MNKKNHRIGIMVSKRARRKTTLKRYLPYCPDGDTLFCFTPQSIDWEDKSITGLRRTSQGWKIGKVPFPDVVYNRCYEIKDNLIQRLENVIGKGKCFNHRNRFHKLELYKHLKKDFAAHLPVTVPYEHKTAVQLLEKYSEIYFKPYYGNSGKGVIRAARQENGEIHIGDHYYVPEFIVTNMEDFRKELDRLIGDKPYLVQAGIPIDEFNGKVFDMRALVQKNSKGKWLITNMISRIASPGSFNTSMCDAVRLTEDLLQKLYPKDKKDEIIRSAREISLKAAGVLEKKTKYLLGEISVDLALDSKGHLWIIEVNGMPQKSLYEDIQDSGKVYQRPMEYAWHLARHAD